MGLPQPMKAWDELGYIVPGYPDTERAPAEFEPWPEQQYRRRVVAWTNMQEPAIRLAEEGIGAIYIPELSVQPCLIAGRLAIIAEAPVDVTVQLTVISRKGVRPSPAIRLVLEALAQTSPETKTSKRQVACRRGESAKG